MIYDIISSVVVLLNHITFINYAKGCGFVHNELMEANYIDINEAKESTIIKEKKLIFYRVVKRIFDIICAFIGILVMVPITIIIKISYILTGDFKSIFFVQKRIGKNGKEFYLYKYRTMIYNADKKLEELLKDPKYKKEWDKNQKLDNDPRITKLGKLLRKTSLDELPQMYNILYNDMSVIGPRPLVPGELDAHDGDHAIYEKVKPGITGWWASHGRSATTYEERLELEYFYVKNRSIKLDIKCIFATIGAVIRKTGAQ